MQEITDNITVVIRIRPLNEREKQENDHYCFRIEENKKNTIIFDSVYRMDTRYFTFDHICLENTTQSNIFDVVAAPVANFALKGYNGCIFAYGQTGAGKTFTIQGAGLESYENTTSISQDDNRGLLPRAFEYVFASIINEVKNNSEVEYLVRCSYLEIYNEHIIDLLNTTSGNLQLREDLKKGAYVEGLTEENILNADQALEILKKGNRNRHIGSTNMNIESSRSHSVFTLTIESKSSDNGIIHIKTSKFSIVDLAGSERQKLVGTVGERLKEGSVINKSLSVLANVINSLVDISEGKSRFVHYRDSKLTFLLKHSLGGNAKTTIIANVSPSSISYAETLSTLKFAQRAKLIKNKVTVNEDSTGTVDSLKIEIKRLRQELLNVKSLLDMNTLSMIEDKRSVSPRKTLNSFNDERSVINSKSILEIDYSRTIETESLLKKSIEILTENESHLLDELIKRDDTIESFKLGVSGYEKNEVNLRMIIKLLEDKLSRYQVIINQNLTKEQVTELLKEDFIALQKENEHYRQIFNSSPSYMSLVAENIALKERLESAKPREENSGWLLSDKLKENISLLKVIGGKIDESINERRGITGRANKVEPRSQAGSPHKEKKLEEVISNLRQEMKEKVESFNLKLIQIQQENDSLKLSVSTKESRLLDLQRELEDYKEFKLRSDDQYEKRIKDMVQHFEEIQNTKHSLNELETKNSHLEVRVFELNETLAKAFEKSEELSQSIIEKECILEKERESFTQTNCKYNDQIITLSKEKMALEAKIQEIQELCDSITEEKFVMIQENEELMSKNGNLFQLYEDSQKQIDQALKEKEDLIKEFEHEKQIESNKFKALQAEVENLKIQIEEQINEKTKFQEDNDTLSQALEYKTMEITEKSKAIQQLTIESEGRDKAFKDLAERFKVQEQKVVSLQQEIIDQSSETSPYNLLVKEYEAHKVTSQQIEANLNESTQKAKSLESELSSLQTKLKEVQESEADFRSGYNEFKDQLHTLNQEHSELREKFEIKLQESTDLTTMNEQLTSKLDNVEKECEQLKSTVFTLEETQAKLKEALESSQQESNQLKQANDQAFQDIQKLNEECTDLKTNLSEANKNHSEVLEKLKGKIQEIVEAKLEKESLNEKIAELKQESEELRLKLEESVDAGKQLSKSLDVKISEVKQYIQLRDQLLSKLEDSEHEVNELKSKFKQSYDENSELHAKMEFLECENSSLMNSLREANSNLKNLEIEHTNFVIAVEEERKGVLEKSQFYDAVEHDFLQYKEESNIEIESLRDQVKKWKIVGAELDDRNRELAELRSHFNQSVEELAVANEAGQALKESVQNIQKELATKNNEIKILTDEIDALNEENLIIKDSNANIKAELEKRSNEYNDNINKLTQTNVALRESNEKITQSLTEKSEELDSIEKKYTKKSNELKDATEALRLLEAKSNNLEKELKELKENYETVNSEYLKLQAASSNIESSAANKESEYQKKLAHLIQDRERLKLANERLEGIISETTSTLEKGQAQIHELVKKIEEVEGAKFELQKSVEQKESKLNELASTYQKSLEENISLRDQMMKIQDESCISNQKLRKELEEKEIKYNKDLETLKAQNRTLLDEMEAQKSTSKGDNGAAEYIKKLLEIQYEMNTIKEISKSLDEENEGLRHKLELSEKKLRETHEAYHLLQRSQSSVELKSLRDENRLLRQEINEKNDNLIKQQICVDQCRQEIKEWKEKVGERSKQNQGQVKELLIQDLKDHNSRSFEKQISELSEQCLKLSTENRSLAEDTAKTAQKLSGLEIENLKLIDEKYKINEEVKSFKVLELKYKTDYQELSEKLNNLNNDHNQILKEMDALNKINETLTSSNPNLAQTKLLTKFKDENAKLREDLTKASEERDRIRKKLDAQQDAITEKDKKVYENKVLLDVFAKINAQIRSNLTKEDVATLPKTNDLDGCLAGVQQLTNLLMEKNKSIHNKETELEGLHLRNSVLEKEFLIFKQKGGHQNHHSHSGSGSNLQHYSSSPLNLKNSNLPSSGNSSARGSSQKPNPTSKSISLKKGTPIDENKLNPHVQEEYYGLRSSQTRK